MGGGVKEGVVSIKEPLKTPGEAIAFDDKSKKKLSEQVAKLEGDFVYQYDYNQNLIDELKAEKEQHQRDNDSSKRRIETLGNQLISSEKELALEQSRKNKVVPGKWKKFAIALLIANVIDGAIILSGFLGYPIDKLATDAIMTLVNDANIQTETQHQENE